MLSPSISICSRTFSLVSLGLLLRPRHRPCLPEHISRRSWHTSAIPTSNRLLLLLYLLRRPRLSQRRRSSHVLFAPTTCPSSLALLARPCRRLPHCWWQLQLVPHVQQPHRSQHCLHRPLGEGPVSRRSQADSQRCRGCFRFPRKREWCRLQALCGPSSLGRRHVRRRHRQQQQRRTRACQAAAGHGPSAQLRAHACGSFWAKAEGERW